MSALSEHPRLNLEGRDTLTVHIRLKDLGLVRDLRTLEEQHSRATAEEDTVDLVVLHGVLLHRLNKREIPKNYRLLKIINPRSKPNLLKFVMIF